MKQKFTILIAAAVMLLAIMLQPTRLWGQERIGKAYVRITSLSELSNDSKIIFAIRYNSTATAYKAMGNTISNKISTTAFTSTTLGTYEIAPTSITNNINSYNWTVSISNSNYSFTDANNKQIGWSSGANFANGSGTKTWAISSYTTNNGGMVGGYTAWKILNTGSSNKRCFALNNSNPQTVGPYDITTNASSSSYNFAIDIFVEKDIYTLSYNGNNNDDGTAPSEVTRVTGTSVTIDGNTGSLTRTGFTFGGWCLNSSGTGTIYGPDEGQTHAITLTDDVELYAKWIANSDYITVAPSPNNVPCASGSANFTTSTNIASPSFAVQFYTTADCNVNIDRPDWLGAPSFGEGTLSMSVSANTGVARYAYFKVYSGTTYSNAVTINQAAYAPAAPVIPATTSFDYTMNVTMSQEAGKTIYYTTDGSTPSNSSTEYTGAFDINATTTVKAIAYDGEYPSAVVSATYTRVYEPMGSIASTDGSHKVKGTVVAKNTRGFIVADHTGYMYYYKNAAPTQDINANVEVSGSLTSYGHVIEFNSSSTVSSASSTTYTSGTPTLIDGDDMYDVLNAGSTKYRTDYQEFVGDLTKDGTNYNITVKGNSHDVTARASYATDAQNTVLENLKGKTVKVKGYYAGDASNIYYVMLGSVEAVPVVTTSVTSISDFTYNVGGGPDAKNFTVSGANLTGDITVSTNSENFEISSDNSNWQTSDITISKGSGTVDATTIYVRLKSGLSSATYNGKITVSSENADDKEIALTGTVKHIIAYNTSLPTGCSVSSEPNGAQVAGESVSVSATAGSGYKFSAWDVYKTGESSTNVTVTNNTFTMPDYNVTVSATFVEAYSVTYNANGGTGEMSDPDSPYISGSTVTVLDNKFTREGYEFSSWNTKSDGSGYYYNPDDEFLINADTTLYAQWGAQPFNVALSSVANVDLLASYGSSSTIEEEGNANVAYGTEITLSATNVTAGKVFIWSVKKQSDNSDVTDDVLNGDVLTVPAYHITIGGSVEDVKAVYTVVKPSTTITVSSSGICPDESEAAYSTTYNTLGQLTAGNYMTLTLTGYQNQIIKGIDLEMHSNAPGSGVKGAGYMSAVVGTDTIAKVGKSTSDVNFNEWPGMTAYTSSYTNVSIPMTTDTRKIEDDETIVIKITATANSLYCDKFTIYYETSTTPVINAENVNLVYTATSGEIPYTITNPNGSSLSAVKTTGDWISAVTVNGANSKVTFTTTANSGVGREGAITLSYTDASDKVVKVYQEAQKYTVTYAGNGGTGSMTDSNSPYEYGAEVTLLDNTFTAPSGKMFNGWLVTEGSSNPVSVFDGKFTMPQNNVTVTAQWRDKDKYQLVNSTAGLVAGKHYIITSGTTGTVYAMGYQNTNNRPKSAAVSFDGDKIYEDSDIWDFVLSGDATNGWTLYDKYTSDGGFLYAASSSDNHLKLQTTLDANGKWTIDFSDDAATIVAKGSNTHKYIRYNTSGLFSCYESGKQAAIYLYVKVNDEDYEIYSPTPITGSQEIESLVIEDKLTIKDGATLMVNGTLTNTTAANLVIEDGGQLITKSSGVKATVKKNVTAADNWGEQDPEDPYTPTGWYFIASPVNGAAFPTGTVANQDIFQLDWANNKWLNLQYSGNNALLSAGFQRGTGYLYASKDGNTLSVAGEIKPLTEADTAKVILKTTGWNLIGNPLTCKVTVDCAFSELVNASAVTNKEANSVINPCQGIAVYGDAETEVTFTKAATQDAVAPSNNNSLQMTLAKTITSRGDVSTKVVDNAVVSFKESKCMPKFNMIGGNTKLFIPQDDEEYSIVFSDRQGDVPLYFKANETGTYTISFAGDEMSLNGIYLIDILAEEEIDLSVNPSYTFIGSPADRMARFKIVFRNANGDGTSDIFAYQSGNDIIVSGEGELQIFDVMGRMVSKQRVNGVETVNVKSQGVYIFRLNDKTQKIVVR